ncbi:unnamed protein product [marine sediment metagenome]|uniref:Uncharacterized protein n=1 Tax=marine sediment metagenome TaxID=412755 RepID=X1MG57_9ZZZZ
MTEQSVALQPGESKVVSFEATPHEARTYHVSVDGLSGSFKAIEAVPKLVTFSVEVYNIPSYAAGSYQYFLTYGGKNWGMVDPQGGVWTPISDPIVVADVPASGTLTATLMAGAYQNWAFRFHRNFRDDGAYRFNLGRRNDQVAHLELGTRGGIPGPVNVEELRQRRALPWFLWQPVSKL